MSWTHASGPPRRRRPSRRKDVQRLHCEDLSHHCTLPSHNKYKYNCRTNTNTGTNTLRIQTHCAAWLCMVCPTSYVQDCLCLWNTLYLNFVFVCGTQCGPVVLLYISIFYISLKLNLWYSCMYQRWNKRDGGIAMGEI